MTEGLTKEEWDRLEYLLGKDHVVGIDQTEMDEIINLLNKQYPNGKRDTRFKRKDWIQLGLISVGAQLMIRQMRLINPPETFARHEEVYKDIYGVPE